MVDGEEAVFNCTVVGDPLPTISWYISGVDLSLSNMAPFDQEGKINDYFINTTVIDTTTVMSSLTLNETVPFLAEDYVCVASSSLGSVNRTATLTVHGELKLVIYTALFLEYSVFKILVNVRSSVPQHVYDVNCPLSMSSEL